MDAILTLISDGRVMLGVALGLVLSGVLVLATAGVIALLTKSDAPPRSVEDGRTRDVQRRSSRRLGR